MRRFGFFFALLCAASPLTATASGASPAPDSHRDRGPCDTPAQRVITREQLDRTGAITVAEALRRAPRQAPHTLPECQQNDEAPAHPDASSSG